MQLYRKSKVINGWRWRHLNCPRENYVSKLKNPINDKTLTLSRGNALIPLSTTIQLFEFQHKYSVKTNDIL